MDEDDGHASFRVALSHAFAQTVTVQASTVDGTANSGSDYNPVTNRLVRFAANETMATVDVTVLDDGHAEPDEAFMLQLSNPSTNAGLSTSPQADATIRDNDVSTGPTNVVFECVEGGGVFTLNASWGPPMGTTASGYQIQLSSNPVAWHFTGSCSSGLGRRRRCRRLLRPLAPTGRPSGPMGYPVSATAPRSPCPRNVSCLYRRCRCPLAR